MVEEDAVAGVDAVGLPVVDGDPIGVELRDAVRGAGIEGGGFLLRCLLDEAVELGGRCLVEAGLFLQPEEADGLQQPESADRIDIGGVFRRFERDGDMGLRAQVIDFVRLDLGEQAGQVGGVRQISVVRRKREFSMWGSS